MSYCLPQLLFHVDFIHVHISPAPTKHVDIILGIKRCPVYGGVLILGGGGGGAVHSTPLITIFMEQGPGLIITL